VRVKRILIVALMFGRDRRERGPCPRADGRGGQEAACVGPDGPTYWRLGVITDAKELNR
jgi:hypothetical protein